MPAYRNDKGRFREPTALEKNVDIRSEEDVHKLETMLGNGGITLILVYADWCGHCHRYLPTWSDLESTPGRTANMARVHYDMQDKIPALSSAKLQGYPSVLKVLPDGTIQSYESPEGSTNAMPTMRDMEVMKRELRSGQAGGQAFGSPFMHHQTVPAIPVKQGGGARRTKKAKRMQRGGFQAQAQAPYMSPFVHQQAGPREAMGPSEAPLAADTVPVSPFQHHQSATAAAKQMGGAGVMGAFVSAVQQAGPAALLLLANAALTRRGRGNHKGGFKSPKRQSRRASTRRSRR